MRKALLVLFILSFLGVSAQKKKDLLVTFYNVENLFDTIDNPHKLDNDFLPDGKKKWDSKRYQTKLNNLSKVLSGINKKHLPDIIGLCEIENKQVVEDLINTGNLKKGKYEIIHYESPDIRGIDNALIYNKKKFTYLDSKPLKVSLPNDKKFKTRDILYVKGIYEFKIIHIYVNHWPSRRGGQEKSEHKRIQAAKTLKWHMDSIFKTNQHSKVVIMGDFNDEPNNKSIYEVLKASDTLHKSNYSSLLNLSYKYLEQDSGTYHYWRENKWNTLDQVIVSRNLFIKPVTIWNDGVKIFAPEWILYKNENNDLVPNKTYGAKYYGGYSDHLPVYFYVRKK